jgi:hypothetical protein
MPQCTRMDVNRSISAVRRMDFWVRRYTDDILSAAKQLPVMIRTMILMAIQGIKQMALHRALIQAGQSEPGAEPR